MPKLTELVPLTPATRQRPGVPHVALAALFLAAPLLANTPLQDTAVVALKAAHDSPTGTSVEHGGMLIRNGETIRYVEPRDGNETGVRVIDRDLLGPGEVLFGTYHTHLCMSGYYHQVFSTQDVVVAVLTGLPEFMLDQCTGEVHEFYAKLDKIRETAIIGHLFGPNCERVEKYLPAGTIVGNIGVNEKLRPALNEEPCKPVKPLAVVTPEAGADRTLK
jgi:hypothetical protein